MASRIRNKLYNNVEANMIEGILFELTMIIMKRSGFETETVTVLECPAEKVIQEMHERYSTPGFRVYIKCEKKDGFPM